MAAARPATSPALSGDFRGIPGQAWWFPHPRQVAPDAGGCRLESAQDVLRLDEHRLPGDLGGDLRVAVAIAADPAPESQERRRRRPIRPGFARIERTAEFAVDSGHEPEERLVENTHQRANLIEWLQLLAAQLGSSPEPVDLLEQSPADLQLRASATPGTARRSSWSPTRRIAEVTARRRASVGCAGEHGMNAPARRAARRDPHPQAPRARSQARWRALRPDRRRRSRPRGARERGSAPRQG